MHERRISTANAPEPCPRESQRIPGNMACGTRAIHVLYYFSSNSTNHVNRCAYKCCNIGESPWCKPLPKATRHPGGHSGNNYPGAPSIIHSLDAICRKQKTRVGTHKMGMVSLRSECHTVSAEYKWFAVEVIRSPKGGFLRKFVWSY